MMKIGLLLCLFVSQAFAYVPTVESLLRHGSNPDITMNGMSITLAVKKLQPGPANTSSNQDVSLLSETVRDEYYRLFFTKSSDSLKVSQTRYVDNTFSEASLEDKIYYSNVTPYTFKGEDSERGIFVGMLKSILFNDGAFLVNFLRTQGVPVRLNHDLINREKIEYLSSYKRYLVTINKDRNARKTEVNPLRPENAEARHRVEAVMNASMYVDTDQVKLSKQDGEMAWLITAGNFEAVVSYKTRDIQKLKFKSGLGEFEIICKDYWLGNGTHSIPKTLLVKDFKGELFQVDVTNLRHFSDKEDDLVKRLKRWDEILKGKTSTNPRPAFLL